MKLVHTGYHLDIPLKENQITVLSVEHPKAYSEILNDIWRQCQGDDGKFILSQQEKEKNIAKEMECIFNPFSLDCNDKKILNKLHSEIMYQADNFLQNEMVSLNQSIILFLEKAIQHVPYSIDYNVDVDFSSILKMYGVKIEYSYENLLEKIVEYLKVLRLVCNIHIFVFVGLKQYLTEEELKSLYEFVFYNKINLIIVEAIHSSHIEGEKCWLLDKDMCIIEL